MNTEEVFLVFSIIAVTVGCGVNILFYRLVFRKQKRMRANTFSWLSNIGIMLAINFLACMLLIPGTDVGSFGGAIGFPLVMIFFMTPLLTIAPSSFYALIRFIYILATKSKERPVGKIKTPEPKLD